MNNKKLSKLELFCVVTKCFAIKIEGHTINEIFESVNAKSEGNTDRLFIYFKGKNYYFSLDSDRMYDVYKQTNYDFSATFKALVSLAEKQYDKMENVTSASNEATDVLNINNIYVQVMPYNEEYFSDKVSVSLSFDDKLHAMFRCYVGRADGVVSIPITKAIYALHFNKFTMDEFYKIALENTERLFPLTITRMTYAMEMALSLNGYSSDEIRKKIECTSKHNFLYMIKTDANLYGANAFLASDILRDFSEKIGCSFYILPGSTRELYFASEQNPVKPDDWLPTIKGANQITPEDFLSEHLYYYDKLTGKISIYK